MVDALTQPREIAEDLFQHVGAVPRRAPEHPEPEVLEHREVRQHATLLWNPRDPATRDLVSPERRDVLAAHAHMTPARSRDAHDRAQRRRLAGAVASDERDHLAFGGRQRHALENMGLAVVGMDVLDGEKAHRLDPR